MTTQENQVAALYVPGTFRNLRSDCNIHKSFAKDSVMDILLYLRLAINISFSVYSILPSSP